MSNCIRGFTANAPFENHAMMHLFQSTGLKTSSSTEGDARHLSMRLQDEPA